MTIKNAVFWDIIPCGRGFGVNYRLHHQGDQNPCARNNVSVRQLLVTGNVDPSSQILFTLMMEALLSSETSFLTRATLYNITEDGILRSDS
jgi:hypothetical protein